MPTIKRLPDCTLYMYAGDHAPPHFHVELNDGREALIAIATLTVLKGNIPARELKTAMAWAVDNQAHLHTTWKVLNP
ncbi:MAG: DUF4160 domain-containing protein [Pseudomonadota bacterium]|nr:DUF4160 domain-containing protein [Pseudomonadota bacterium]